MNMSRTPVRPPRSRPAVHSGHYDCPRASNSKPGERLSLRRIAKRRRSGDNPPTDGRTRVAQHFDPKNAPFDRLSPEEVRIVREELDIGYFCPGETIIARDSAPHSLFIIIKGSVEERDGDE